NMVCTNLSVSTDGFSNQIRVVSVDELDHKIKELVLEYNMEKHIDELNGLADYSITETQFAHLVGKLRMFQHLEKEISKNIFPLQMNDGQVSNVVKDYYGCPNFRRNGDGSIDLWKLYNLFTE